MDTRKYGPVSQPQAEQFLTEAQNKGLTVTRKSAFSGEVSGYGAEVGYVYDPGSQSITLELRRAPLFFANVVWSQIEQRLPANASRLS